MVETESTLHRKRKSIESNRIAEGDDEMEEAFEDVAAIIMDAAPPAPSSSASAKALPQPPLVRTADDEKALTLAILTCKKAHSEWDRKRRELNVILKQSSKCSYSKDSVIETELVDLVDDTDLKDKQLLDFEETYNVNGTLNKSDQSAVSELADAVYKSMKGSQQTVMAIKQLIKLGEQLGAASQSK